MKGHPLPRRLREPDSYGMLLVLVLASIMVSAFANTTPSRTIVVLFQLGVLAFALWTSRTPRRLVLAFAVCVLVTLARAAAALAIGGTDGSTVKGSLDVAVSAAMKDENDMWGLGLVVGLLEVLLGFWVSQQIFAPRAVLIITWVGFAALFRGIGEIATAFHLRRVATRLES